MQFAPGQPIKFHKDVWFPPTLRSQVELVLARTGGKLTLTAHAAERAREKRVELPDRMPVAQVELIEATIVDRQLQKFLVRFPSPCGRRDIVVAYTVTGRVTTCYYNARNDRHHTLNVREYMRAP